VKFTVVLVACLLPLLVLPQQSGQSGRKTKIYEVHPPHRPPTLEDTLRGVPSEKPAKGFVPDETTAVRIAEAVLIPIYGEERIKAERPFKAGLKGGIWTVQGFLDWHRYQGGTAIIKIAKSDGRILFVTHQQ